MATLCKSHTCLVMHANWRGVHFISELGDWKSEEGIPVGVGVASPLVIAPAVEEPRKGGLRASQPTSESSMAFWK